MNTLRTIGGGGGQIAVAYAEPPVSPPSGRPVAVASPAPVHAATPVVPMASAQPSSQPVSPAAPQAPAEAGPAPSSGPAPDPTVAVFLHLKGGKRIWAGRFDTPDLAEERANEIVRELLRPAPGVWATFGNRLIRPEAVVSIELAPRRED